LAWFKTRNGLREFKYYSKATSVSLEIAKKEQQCIQELVEKEGIEL
jgi:hypothetical protein